MNKEVIEKLLENQLMDLTESEEILQRYVTPVGNSGHVIIPRKHIGKIAKILIYKKEYGKT